MLMSVETPFNWGMLLEHCKFWKKGPVSSNFFYHMEGNMGENY